ncbi:hypothetical protein BC826DRAFT_1025538 [Russula brevipes]|nr:hypothetical protein BC826DRAFT_1025538 [Russula brevipes]
MSVPSCRCDTQSYGLPLIDFLRQGEGGIPSPGELFETILHAIIVHQKRQCLPGVLVDGDRATNWRTIPVSLINEHKGTFRFLSLRLMRAQRTNQPTMQTAVDDLESFLWLLVWALFQIFQHPENATNSIPGIPSLETAFSGTSMEAALGKCFVTSHGMGRDAVFGGLIREWLRIFDSARDAVMMHVEAVSSMPVGSSDWEEACNGLASFWRGGYKHFEKIRMYSNWIDVVEANAS